MNSSTISKHTNNTKPDQRTRAKSELAAEPTPGEKPATSPMPPQRAALWTKVSQRVLKVKLTNRLWQHDNLGKNLDQISDNLLDQIYQSIGRQESATNKPLPLEHFQQPAPGEHPWHSMDKVDCELFLNALLAENGKHDNLIFDPANKLISQQDLGTKIVTLSLIKKVLLKLKTRTDEVSQKIATGELATNTNADLVSFEHSSYFAMALISVTQECDFIENVLFGISRQPNAAGKTAALYDLDWQDLYDQKADKSCADLNKICLNLNNKLKDKNLANRDTPEQRQQVVDQHLQQILKQQINLTRIKKGLPVELGSDLSGRSYSENMLQHGNLAALFVMSAAQSIGYALTSMTCNAIGNAIGGASQAQYYLSADKVNVYAEYSFRSLNYMLEGCISYLVANNDQPGSAKILIDEPTLKKMDKLYFKYCSIPRKIVYYFASTKYTDFSTKIYKLYSQIKSQQQQALSVSYEAVKSTFKRALFNKALGPEYFKALDSTTAAAALSTISQNVYAELEPTLLNPQEQQQLKLIQQNYPAAQIERLNERLKQNPQKDIEQLLDDEISRAAEEDKENYRLSLKSDLELLRKRITLNQAITYHLLHMNSKITISGGDIGKVSVFRGNALTILTNIVLHFQPKAEEQKQHQLRKKNALKLRFDSLIAAVAETQASENRPAENKQFKAKQQQTASNSLSGLVNQQQETAQTDKKWSPAGLLHKISQANAAEIPFYIEKHIDNISWGIKIKAEEYMLDLLVCIYNNANLSAQTRLNLIKTTILAHLTQKKHGLFGDIFRKRNDKAQLGLMMFLTALTYQGYDLLNMASNASNLAFSIVNAGSETLGFTNEFLSEKLGYGNTNSANALSRMLSDLIGLLTYEVKAEQAAKVPLTGVNPAPPLSEFGPLTKKVDYANQIQALFAASLEPGAEISLLKDNLVTLLDPKNASNADEAILKLEALITSVDTIMQSNNNELICSVKLILNQLHTGKSYPKTTFDIIMDKIPLTRPNAQNYLALKFSLQKMMAQVAIHNEDNILKPGEEFSIKDVYRVMEDYEVAKSNSETKFAAARLANKMVYALATIANETERNEATMAFISEYRKAVKDPSSAFHPLYKDDNFAGIEIGFKFLILSVFWSGAIIAAGLFGGILAPLFVVILGYAVGGAGLNMLAHGEYSSNEASATDITKHFQNQASDNSAVKLTSATSTDTHPAVKLFTEVLQISEARFAYLEQEQAAIKASAAELTNAFIDLELENIAKLNSRVKAQNEFLRLIIKIDKSLGTPEAKSLKLHYITDKLSEKDHPLLPVLVSSQSLWGDAAAGAITGVCFGAAAGVALEPFSGWTIFAINTFALMLGYAANEIDGSEIIKSVEIRDFEQRLNKLRSTSLGSRSTSASSEIVGEEYPDFNTTEQFPAST